MNNQPNLGRQPYHLNPNQINHFYLSNPSPNNIGVSRVKSQSNRLVASQVKNEDVVKGQSRVNYVPYEKKIIQYEDRTYVEKVPIKRKVIKYEERRVIETVPREVIKQDYYAVQTRTQYFKEVIPEKRIQVVPVQKKIKRYEYVPIEKQIIHYPQNFDPQTAKGQSRVILQNQGVQVKADAEFRPINPTLIYNYSARPQSKYNPIGYVDQGQSRVFSNSPTFMNPQGHSYLQQPINQGEYSNYGYYEQQQQPQYVRSQSAQRLQPRGVYSPRLQVGQPRNYPQGESYIKELNNIGKGGELKRPFELLQQSTANNNHYLQTNQTAQRGNSNLEYQEYHSQQNEEQHRGGNE